MQELASLIDLLCHEDPEVRAQGAALLLALPPAEAGAALSRLPRWNSLRLEGLSAARARIPAGGMEECEWLGCDLPGVDLRGAAVQFCALRASAMRGGDLRGARLENCTLYNADLSGAALSGGQWIRVQAGRARLEGAAGEGWTLREVSLPLAFLRGARLERSDAERVDLQGADLRGVSLAGARLVGVSLRGADLREADLRKADLRGVDLRGADLSGAAWEGCRLAGVLADEACRGSVPAGAVRLEPGAELRGMHLEAADLAGADLRVAWLTRADLRGADLRGAQLAGASLRCANLEEADLRGADLRGADLSGAMLADADLRGSDLRGAALLGADCYGALADLSTRWPGEAPAGVRLLAPGARLERLELSDFDLRGVNLRGAEVKWLSLDRVDLRDADLGGLTCEHGSLHDVDLRGADLSGIQQRLFYLLGAVRDERTRGAEALDTSSAFSKVSGRDVRFRSPEQVEGLDLRGADLRGRNLERASGAGADLRGADLRGASLPGADLEGALLDAETQADDRAILQRCGAVEVPRGWRPGRLPPVPAAPLAKAPAWMKDAGAIPVLPGMRLRIADDGGWERAWQPPPAPMTRVQIALPGARGGAPDLGDPQTFSMAASWLALGIERGSEGGFRLLNKGVDRPAQVKQEKKGWRLFVGEKAAEDWWCDFAGLRASTPEEALAKMWRRWLEDPAKLGHGERFFGFRNPPPSWLGRSPGRKGDSEDRAEELAEGEALRQKRRLERLKRRFLALHGEDGEE